MKGFITYLTYNVIENEACICLFGRLENREGFYKKINFKNRNI